MTDGSGQTAPGWYYCEGDPPGSTRYWDGEVWQSQVNYGQQPAAAQPAAVGARPSGNVEWITRVGATLIDTLILLPVAVAVFAISAVLGSISDSLSIVGFLLAIPIWLGFMYVLLWLPGVIGTSPGRRFMGYEIVRQADGQYLGGPAFLGRQLVGGLINNLCYIDVLWPLWDKQNQRLADKVVSSVPVQTGKRPIFPIFPNGKPF